jgi:hypothetical protein
MTTTTRRLCLRIAHKSSSNRRRVTIFREREVASDWHFGDESRNFVSELDFFSLIVGDLY